MVYGAAPEMGQLFYKLRIASENLKK